MHLAVLDRSTHETILPELRAAEARIGVPRAIVSDEGSDIGKAVRLYAGPATVHILDLAHQGANLLKNRWTRDPRWKEFLEKLTQTNQRIRQTELAYLLSPRLRAKGRFLSVGVVLRFVRRIVYWLDQGLAQGRGVAEYGWVLDYRLDLTRWWREQQVVQATVAEVRLRGWKAGTGKVLEEIWQQVPAESESGDLVKELRSLAKASIDQVGAGETLPGSTEVLESSFGKWKCLVEMGPSVGVSRLVLGLGSVMKPLPAEEVAEGLDRTPMKCVWQWLGDKVGGTMQKLRQAFHRETKPAVA